MLRYFSLFSGIGGLDFGLRKLATCVGFSEIKNTSIQIFKKHCKAENYDDISKIDYKSLPDFDILLGGFPCQSFSLAGLRKGFEDERGKMIFRIYDILKEKKPKYFVLENIKGLLNHDQGKTFLNVMKLLTYAEYNIRVVLLNSLYYGSAQSRERLFFLGSKDDFEINEPIIVDDKKRFRDIRDDDDSKYRLINKTDRNILKINQKHIRNFELIGGYDRVGTLTTQYGCGEKVVPYKDWYRYLTVLECERLQGFPDDWTKGISDNARYWVLGNAVNCDVSKYLFNNYLKSLWW